MAPETVLPALFIFGSCIIQGITVRLTKKTRDLWVVLPGLMGSAQELADIMVPQGVSTLCVDYTSNHCDRYIDLCNHLLACIQSYQSTYTIHLLGYSMGGRWLISILNQCLNMVQSVTLMSCSMPLETSNEHTEKRRFEQLALDMLEKTTPQDFCYWWYNQPIYHPLSSLPEFDQLIVKRTNQFNKEQIKQCLLTYSVRHMPPVTPMAASTNRPMVYYMVGEHDKKYRQMGNRLLGWIPWATIQIVPNAGHLWLTFDSYVNHLNKYVNH